MRINPWERVVTSTKCYCGLCDVAEHACLLQGAWFLTYHIGFPFAEYFYLEERTVSSTVVYAREGGSDAEAVKSGRQ
jgi:hypothetical protein